MTDTIFIHPAEARRQFRDFAARELGPSDLARGSLLIALEEYPALDVEGSLAVLEQIATRVLAHASPGDPPVFLLGYLHSEMFDREGFSGDEVDYYDPRNSYLNEVLDRKLGLPITLSIIFMDLAQRIGLKAVGVGLPGHYLVKVQFDLNELYVDPYHAGQTLTLKEIDDLLSDMSRGRIRLKSEHLRGWTERETLVRLLSNLKNAYARRGDARRAAFAQERIDILAGDSPA
ncbi:MAG: transglutaminase-like domain-containing protein [Acidobacteriota bacterium]